MPTRLCSYVVVHDSGFAPNPFGGYCTLAACTPNHQGLRLSRGDWILGNATAQLGNRIVYAMQVSEVLDFDDYYRDRRFQHKKPRFDGTWQDACGDNIYYRQKLERTWAQRPTLFHGTPWERTKDTRHPRVFVSEHFYYFGENAPDIPEQFSALTWDRQGCKCSHPEGLIQAFLAWLRTSFVPGIHGAPRDREWTYDTFGPRRLYPLGRTTRGRRSGGSHLV